MGSPVNAPLDAMAKLCGFPGKLEDLPRYCETDVMNTCLLYCRFHKMRGGLLEPEYEHEIALVKETLGQLAPAKPHRDEYLKAWG